MIKFKFLKYDKTVEDEIDRLDSLMEKKHVRYSDGTVGYHVEGDIPSEAVAYAVDHMITLSV